MKRLLFYTAVLCMTASIVITPLAALADKGVISEIGAAAITVDTRPHRLGDNTVTQATGKTWIDADTRERLYEYTARIDSAPTHTGGALIDCAWQQNNAGQWVSGANVFSATVNNRVTKVKYDNRLLIWSPQVFVGGKEYVCDKEPYLLPVDPINENYKNNTLAWDYGVCVRQLRIIEGMISEVYIFDRDPGADVWIKSNRVKDRDFEGELPVFAFDAGGESIPISDDKVVKAEDLKGASYPVTIDPTSSFTTSASDGHMGKSATNYTVSHDATSGVVSDTTTYYSIGQYEHNDPGIVMFTIYRGAVYFDTSAIPDGAIISAANLSLYGKTDISTVDFNITISNGMDTYPHDPLEADDYNKDNYTGLGSAGFNTSGFSITGYNNISLNATGLGWIDDTGTTKFYVLSEEDYNTSAPAYNTNEYVIIYSYEQGAGYRPTLYVTYASAGPPTVTTQAASYVSSTTARINGYLDIDGGEQCTVYHEYSIVPNENWQFEESDIEWEYIGFEGVTRSDTTSYYGDYAGLLTAPYFYQELSATQYVGENVSVSMWVNTSAADTAWIELRDNAGTTVSANHSGSGDWELLTVSRTIDAGATSIWISGNKSTTGTVTPTGGTITTDGDYTVHKFTASGSFVTQFSGDIAVLAVAGGGGAGTGATTTTYNAGGGGAGGVVYISNYAVDAGNLSVTVGGGGGGAANVNVRGTKGSNSVFGDLTAVGGGGGGSSAATYRTGSDGGSGGGAARYSTTYSAGGGTIQTTTNDGYVNTGFGSEGVTSSVGGAGGGGGAGATGSTKTGGIGKAYTISGASVTYAEGGDAESDASNGAANTGDGGHAAATNSAAGGGDGGSGIVIVRYVAADFISYTGDDAWFDGVMIRVDGIPPIETSTQLKNTGENYYNNLTALLKNQTYAFRAIAENTDGVAYGAWLDFFTIAVTQGPENLAGYPQATTLDLNWQKGLGGVNTLVRYKVGSYPLSTADGSLVYYGLASSYTHTGLTPGTTYYYRAWCDDGYAEYSANYSSVMVTTMAGSTASGATPEAPTMPGNWFGSPDYTSMENAPLYGMWNAVADSMEMPRNSFWMLLTILNIILISFILFFLSKGNLVIAVGASAVCIAAAGAITLISWWYVGIYLIIALAFSYRAITR